MWRNWRAGTGQTKYACSQVGLQRPFFWCQPLGICSCTGARRMQQVAAQSSQDWSWTGAKLATMAAFQHPTAVHQERAAPGYLGPELLGAETYSIGCRCFQVSCAPFSLDQQKAEGRAPSMSTAASLQQDNRGHSWLLM